MSDKLSINKVKIKRSSESRKEKSQKKRKSFGDRTENMKAILESKELKVLFKRFMESIHAEENIMFYEDVMFYEYISATNLMLLKEKYEEIVENYICVGADFEINIGVSLRENILECGPGKGIFAEARDHVFNLMCQSVPMFMSQAGDDVRLINMKKIALPVIMVDIVEELKTHDHPLKHWMIDLDDKKLAPFVERTNGVLTIIPGIDIDDLSGKELSGLLKICLVSLPISVITAELPIFFEIILERENYLGKNGDIKELLSTLPSRNQAILHMISELLHLYGHNLNTYMDLGELFAPLLIRNQRKQNSDAKTLAYIFDQYENLFLTPDFRCVREENIAYTGISAYTQISVDLYSIYNEDIKKISTFSMEKTLKSTDWEIILLKSQILEFSEDTPIIQKGVPNLYFYMIKKGTAYATISDDEGNDKIIYLSEKDIIGELSIFTLKEASATVTVTKGSVIAKIFPPDLSRLFGEDQVLAKRFYNVVATKLSKRLRSHDPAISLSFRKSLRRDETKTDIGTYREKFSIMDENEMILKQFNIRNGHIWIGKKFLGIEESTLFSNRRHKTPLKYITSVNVNWESLTIRLDITKKDGKTKKIKFSTNTVEDLNQILIILDNNQEMILPIEETITKSPISVQNEENVYDTKISDAEWEILLGGSSIVELQEGDVIIKQGKNIHKMYLLSRGSATANVSKDDEIFFLGIIEQGEILGEISYLQDCKSTCTVIANEETLIYHIDTQYIELLFHSFPKLASKFFRHLCRLLSKRIIQRENVPAEAVISDTPSASMGRKRLGLEKTLSQTFNRKFSTSSFTEELKIEYDMAKKRNSKSRSRDSNE